jgi:hypothetical protein
LVKPVVAKKQKEEERKPEEPTFVLNPGGPPSNIKDPTPNDVVAAAPALKTRFHGSIELDPTRMGRDAGKIADEIVSHLTSLGGAKARIVLEIDIEVPNGIPDDRVRIVNENSNTLKFKSQEFEEREKAFSVFITVQNIHLYSANYSG